jgi:hypothetical protein
MRTAAATCALVAACAVSTAAFAGDRLAWTGAVTQFEGAGGAGLVPLALIAGLSTEDQVAPTASATWAATGRYELYAAGVALGVRDRLELSYAKQSFSTGSVVPDTTLGQQIFGAKLRVAGDAVFSPHAWWPQVAVGVQHKRTDDAHGIPLAVGAKDLHGTDFYVAATRVFLDGIAGRRALVNAVLRNTDANQFGLLGFGGPKGGRRWVPEISAAVWLADPVLLGVEYREKPDGLAAFREGAAKDVFVAYAPTKHVTFVAAWVDLGTIAGQARQRGAYASVWFGY